MASDPSVEDAPKRGRRRPESRSSAGLDPGSEPAVVAALAALERDPLAARRANWPTLAAGFGGAVERDRALGALGRIRRSFTLGLMLRVSGLTAALAALVWTLWTPGLVAPRLLAALLALAAGWTVWAHVRRTNVELARFVEGLGTGDLAQGFTMRAGDGGFGELGRVLDGAMRRLREERGRLSAEAQYSFALVEEAPTALLTVSPDGRVHLVNKAARRLFGPRDGVDRAAFASCGEAFLAALDPAREAAGRRVVTLMLGGMPQRAMLSVAGLSRLGAGGRLIAVEPIQRALNEAEIAAQTDLVRVLTHEIMNSLTPVTSLARTAATLMERVPDEAGRDVGDAKLAVATLARRADALAGFVDSYRQFARVPTVVARRFDAGAWAEELRRLFAAAAHGRGVGLALDVAPQGLTVEADPDLLAQALINLLKNAAEAARGHAAEPWVWLRIGLAQGGAAAITVEDNGPGLAPGLEGDIFLPFFTTKAEGTGVGLSVARQIVVAHGGTIRAETREGGGARFRVML